MKKVLKSLNVNYFFLFAIQEKMFQAWFNTAFFDQNGMMVVDKFMLDKACKVYNILL